MSSFGSKHALDALTSFEYNCLAWTCPAPRNEQQFRYSHFRDEDSCPHPRWWEPYRRRGTTVLRWHAPLDVRYDHRFLGQESHGGCFQFADLATAGARDRWG